MNKFALIFLIISLTLLPINLSPQQTRKNQSEQQEMSENQNLVNEYIAKMHSNVYATFKSYEFITDITGNVEFTLYDLNPIGYMIYSNRNEEFIEYSFKDLSPYEYFGVNEKEKKYLGPTRYFVKVDDNNFMDVISGKHYSISDLAIMENQFKDNMTQDFLDRKKLKFDKETVVLSTFINESSYFKNLESFPINDRNSCGWTAGAILLGYFDTFYNNNTVSSKWIDGKKTGAITYTGLPFGMTYMPGTLKGFDDVIMNGKAFETVASDVKQGIQSYFNSIGPTFNNNFEINTSIFPLVRLEAKNHIDDGYPYLLFGRYINPVSGDNINHVVTAYGYNGDNFLVHFGWEYGYREVWINGLYGTGLGMKYKGTHIHSNNIYYEHSCKSMCGCGYNTIPNKTHDILYHYYDGSLGERPNFDNHRTGCENCAYYYWEQHNWYNPPLSMFIYCTICYQNLLI